MKNEVILAFIVPLQFAAFGWRINREISVGDDPKGPRFTWLPLPDMINVIMLLAPIGACVVLPLVSGDFGKVSKTLLAAAAVFLAFHPISVAGHYGLITGRGRHRYIESKGDYPPYTNEELISVAVSVLCALSVAYIVYTT